jgi:hypothetical protein
MPVSKHDVHPLFGGYDGPATRRVLLNFGTTTLLVRSFMQPTAIISAVFRPNVVKSIGATSSLLPKDANRSLKR